GRTRRRYEPLRVGGPSRVLEWVLPRQQRVRGAARARDHAQGLQVAAHPCRRGRQGGEPHEADLPRGAVRPSAAPPRDRTGDRRRRPLDPRRRLLHPRPSSALSRSRSRLFPPPPLARAPRPAPRPPASGARLSGHVGGGRIAITTPTTDFHLRRCDDAPAPATRVAPDRAQRPPKLWLRANTSRHKAMSHGRMVAEAARLERECAAIIRGRVRLARADEAAPPARGAEERSGEAGAPSERL